MKKSIIQNQNKKFSKKELGYGLFSRFTSNTNPKYLAWILKNAGLPLVKIFDIIFFKHFSFSGIFRSKEKLIKLEDGAKLATSVVMPKRVWKNKQKAPTIFIRTPYWKERISIIADFIAYRGYVVVLQDIRGSGHSNLYGLNTIFFSEREDGLESINWIKKQFWYNGKLGTWGPSYLGLTQWAMAWENNNLITCLNPSFSSPISMWNLNQGLDLLSINIGIYKIFHDCAENYDAKSSRILRSDIHHQLIEYYLNTPTLSLYNDPIDQSNFNVKVIDYKGLSFKQWVETIRMNKSLKIENVDFSSPNHTQFHTIMTAMLIKRKANMYSKFMFGILDFDVSKISAPIYIVNGWYDIFSKGTIEIYKEIQEKSKTPIKEQTKMIIGPWAHLQMGHPEASKRLSGFKDFVRGIAPIDYHEFFLKDIDNNTKNEPPIKIFIMGKNQWRYEYEWPLKREKLTKLYLDSNGNANSLYGDGRLTWDYPHESHISDNYLHNPMNPVPSHGGNNYGIPRGAKDQREIEIRDDILIYSTVALEKGLEITGEIYFVLFASSNSEDTDFMVKLVDVYPNGKALNIIDGGIRARFRNGDFFKPKLIIPNKIYNYNIYLGPTSYYFKPGHKIRIEISSSNFPKYNVNSNLGGKGKKGDYKIVNQIIYHKDLHPSHIVLPIIEANE